MKKIIPVETVQRLSLGQQGEHLACAITFDFESWQSRYGEGSVQLQVQRPGTDLPYPVPLQVDGTLATWHIEQRDTAKAGKGKLQLLYIVGGEQVAKSHTFITIIQPSLSQPGPVPSDGQTFLDKVSQAAGRAEVAAQNAEKSVQQTTQDLTQTTKDRTAAENAKEQAIQAARAAAKDKTTAENAAQTAVQAVENFDHHAQEQAVKITVLAGQVKDSIAQDKIDTQAAAQQANRDADTVNEAVSIALQQAEATQKAAANAENAASRSETGAAKVEETVASYSENLIERLCVPFITMGSVVTCHPFAGHPLQVVSHIKPVQEGVGNPSPTNVRPIKGWAGAKLVKCGKNLLHLPKNTTESGIIVAKDCAGVHISGTATNRVVVYLSRHKDQMPLRLPEGKYTLSVGANIPSGCKVLFGHYRGNEYAGNLATIGPGNSNTTFTVSEETGLVDGYIDIAKGTTVNITIFPQLEAGTVATSYEPYQGNEYTVQFGQTVYGGSYNWNQGELTELYAKSVLNGSSDEVWNEPDKSGRFSVKLGRELSSENRSEGYCNIAPYDGVKTLVATIADGNTYLYVNAKDLGVGNISELRELLKKTNLVVVYKSMACKNIQFSSQKILAMSGTNTLYGDTGETLVQGRSDMNYEMQQLKDAIAALGAV